MVKKGVSNSSGFSLEKKFSSKVFLLVVGVIILIVVSFLAFRMMGSDKLNYSPQEGGFDYEEVTYEEFNYMAYPSIISGEAQTIKISEGISNEYGGFMVERSDVYNTLDLTSRENAVQRINMLMATQSDFKVDMNMYAPMSRSYLVVSLSNTFRDVLSYGDSNNDESHEKEILGDEVDERGSSLETCQDQTAKVVLSIKITEDHWKGLFKNEPPLYTVKELCGRFIELTKKEEGAVPSCEGLTCSMESKTCKDLGVSFYELEGYYFEKNEVGSDGQTYTTKMISCSYEGTRICTCG